MTGAQGILTLPTELIITVVSHLPLRGIIACGLTCRRLFAIVNQSQLLQCHIRIVHDGMDDLHRPGVSFIDLSAALDKWERAWQDFATFRNPRVVYRAVLPNLWPFTFTFQRGYLVVFLRVSTYTSWAHAGWVYLDISQLPSISASRPQRPSWASVGVQGDVASASVLNGYTSLIGKWVAFFVISKEEGKNSHSLRTLCVLKLPEPNTNIWPTLTAIPGEQVGSGGSPDIPYYSRLPFKSSAVDTILAFRLSISPVESPANMEYSRPAIGPEIVFWVRSSTLRSLAADAILSQSSPSTQHRSGTRSVGSWLRRRIGRSHTVPCQVKQWDDWGPRATRWSKTPISDNLFFTTYGMRSPFVATNHEGEMKLLDFSPGRVFRQLALRDSAPDDSEQPGRVTVVTGPTTLEKGTFFLNDVTSELPYSETTVEGFSGHIFLDDDQIVRVDELENPDAEPSFFGVTLASCYRL
ncbi:hypothetical protein BC834DRAFT_843339 [Gloeopeniophorella convolvens]|nr:hypothetical protein BC834DRAFT_843339 [Gloeopeniophorella convolvens]